MHKILIVGAGGFLGAISRYLLSGLVQRHSGGTFPLGTLTINIIGCFIIGAVMAVAEDRPLLGPDARLFIMIGLLGAFTTFSSFGYESVELLRNGQWSDAIWNVAGNVIFGMGSVILGRFVTRALGI